MQPKSDVPHHLPLSYTPTVLCIDDDPAVSELIQDCLADYEVKLLRAFHGMQGIWMALTQKPDLIITDLRMPRGDGTTVIECLKRNAQTEAIPIVVLTARHDSNLPCQMEKLGVVGYLTKPIHFAYLRYELERHIDVRLKPFEDE